ncbi:hypothetical protein A2U01_0038335 [Trifolium medium]|uniref:Uncharacterized protein n=1 Tax=Trifolium medium TaxID=97028 RepID=A0A392PZB6_9FABA|nr:hypothetical protein [Trifolium medium]
MCRLFLAIHLSLQFRSPVQISQQYSQYLDQMLPEEQRGALALFPWYMRWYFRISHPYMRPILLGGPSRPCEHETLMEEEVEREDPIAADLVVVEGMFSIANYAQRYWRTGGGAPMR